MWSIAGGTVLVFTVALALVLIMTNVVVSMRETANRIDDKRAIALATSAISAVQRRLAHAAEEKVVWGEGGWSVSSNGAPGTTGAEGQSSDGVSPAHDGLAVFSGDLSLIDSRYQGGSLDGSGDAARNLREQAMAAQLRKAPVFRFLKIGGAIAMSAAVAIQPPADLNSDENWPVLVFMKTLDQSVLDMIDGDFHVSGVEVVEEPVPGLINLPLEGASGAVLGYLAWPSRKPGDIAFDRHRPLLMTAGLTLVVFLLLVLGAGAIETTRLRSIAAAAEQEAKRDPLSGTLNRGGFLEVLATLSRDLPADGVLALHMLDLDGFKTVNDTHGHAVGDLLIEAVATRLKGFSNQLAAIGRMGGDEFVLAQVQNSSPQALARQVVDALSQPFFVGGREFRISASIGHASSTKGIEPSELMRRADVAMYAAKAAGKRCALAYVPDMEADSTAEAG